MRVLSIDGGGYLALASASFLDAVEEHFNTRCRERFDLFCGTSAGAILVLALASGKTAAEVVELFERLGGTVFADTYLRWIFLIFIKSLCVAKQGGMICKDAPVAEQLLYATNWCLKFNQRKI